MKKFLPVLFILIFLTNLHAQLDSVFSAGGYQSYVKNIGATSTEVQLAWRQVQKNMLGGFNWSYADSVVQVHQAPGLNTWIVLKCTNPICPADTTPGTCAYYYDSNNAISDNNTSWFPTDTVKWKIFLDSLVERYDGDGFKDMPGLQFPIREWHIGQEWHRIWCSQYADTSLQYVQEFVKYERLTYDRIKMNQPNSTISFAGLTGHENGAFYDGYFSPQNSICSSQNCVTQVNLTHAMLAANPTFLASRRNNIYLMRNAKYEWLDVHMYGDWKHIPNVVQWCKDSAMLGNRHVIFREAGGPFCKACETVYHPASDTTGILPPQLVRDNASSVVYYFITGIANGVKKIHWTISPEYSDWGATWGDLDLSSINHVFKPSYYAYQFMAKNIFSNTLADSVSKISESNPNLYHFKINPMGMEVIWSTNTSDSYTVTGTGTLYRWDIPTACDSVYPSVCDSVVTASSVNVSGSTTISLSNGVPVFFSWNNLTSAENISYENNVMLFPNPASEIASFIVKENSFSGEMNLKIYDVIGNEVLENKNIRQSRFSISVENFSSGIYFYRLTGTNKEIGNGKLLISR